MFEQLAFHRPIAIVLSIAVGLTFAYAVLLKLRDIRAFLVAVGDYPLIPVRFSAWLGTLVIAVELVIAISHLSMIGLQVAAPLAIGLIGTFSAFALVSVKRGDRTPCLCFGVDSREDVGARTIIRLGVLGAAEAVLFVALWSGQFEMPVSVLALISSLPLALILIAIFMWCMAFPEVAMVGRKFLSVHGHFRRIRRRNQTDFPSSR